MKKKIIGIFIVMLLIVTTFPIPFSLEANADVKFEEKINFEQYSSDQSNLFDVKIIKPEKALYLNNEKILPLFFTTLIFGLLTVEVNILGGVAEKVEFYVDNNLKHTDYQTPFKWKWDEKISLKHSITVKSYDQNENPIETTMDVWIFNDEPEIIPPKVWITDPLPTDLLYEPTWDIAVVSDDIIKISAAKIGGSEEIAHSVFEYSSDGMEWVHIGVDANGEFQGKIFEKEENSPWYEGNRKIGDEGWKTIWNNTGFPEGYYFLKATMIDITGRSGSCVRKIYIDRTPPKPIIETPTFGEKVSGTIEFRASSVSEDIISMEVKLYHGSPGWFNQTGLGNARQNPGDGGICAPTATANALAGLGNKKVYPPGKEGNDSAVQQELIDDMDTDKNKGTNCWTPAPLLGPLLNIWMTDNMGDAIKKYLEERGIGCSNETGYDVKVYRIMIDNQSGTEGIVPGSNQITFEEYSKQIRLGQRVVLAFAGPIGLENFKGKRVTFPNGIPAHAVTGRGTNSETNDQGHNEVSIQDTNGENLTCSWTNFSDGGSGNISMIQFRGYWRAIIGMWVICPKSKDASCSSIGIDMNPQDGFVVAYDTNELEEDGVFTFIVEMTDSTGFIGTDAIVIEVDNTPEDEEPPSVMITNPEDEDTVLSPILVTGYATDYDSGVAVFDFKLEWDGGSYDGSEYPIDPPSNYVTFEFGPLYLENYIEPGDWITITIYATDLAENTGSDSITVTWLEEPEDNIPPVTEKTVGEPNEDGGYIIWPFTPIYLEATDDMSGVKYIYYEIAWDTNEDGIWDELFQETIYNSYVEIQTLMYGILSGIIELRWYAVDNADNVEEMHYQKHLIATW